MLGTSRLGFRVAAAALVCSLAPLAGVRPPPAAAAQEFRATKTRFATIDSEYLLKEGINVWDEKLKDGGLRAFSKDVEADLEAFAKRLDVKLVDVALLRGPP